ncbi:YkgB family protein [Legionella sp. W05-934-2]|jgi:uncharacterized membrane protein YkgB|uniref:YkgB family protein n=1 Tax=Legionella sp. W05-934-2 TaxID=1198649 RepID=UPI0034624684
MSGDKNCQVIECAGVILLRLSLVVVLVWIGLMKFTAYEAHAIHGLASSSPLTSWLYSLMDTQTTSNVIGVIEVVTGALILLGMWVKWFDIIGCAMAIITFALTTTYLFTAPGWEGSLGGFPALSVLPGQFLLKDIVLLSAAIFFFGRALNK